MKSKEAKGFTKPPIKPDAYLEALGNLTEAKKAVTNAVEHARKMSLAVVKAKEAKKR
ncbi:hypothetical protein LCGC14_0561370 [marine sediment metagenome]|uniref:Uncharacterized protein n=1 Tax=marine sediment metagenome TaxID=412755 RepID=A0A0F9RLU5_9ZZZZ